MKSSKRIGFVLPAYNEASVIASVLASLPLEIKIGTTIHPTETIVVNDCSTDGTKEAVETFTHVHLINHILNSGAGAATRTGLNYAKQIGCEYVVTLDSDGQHAVEDVVKLAKSIVTSQADMLIGSRLIERRGMPWYRVLGNKGLSFITLIVFGVFVGDSQSGLKALNAKALKTMQFYSDNYAFCSEMIWKAHRSGLVIREVPIQAIYTDYSLSKGQTNWGAIHIVRQLIKRRLLDFIDG